MNRFSRLPGFVRYVLPAIAFALAIVLPLAALAFRQLGPLDKSRVYVEVVKLSYQFIILTLLGLLVTSSVEAVRARRARFEEARKRQLDHLARLISLTQQVDVAKTLISANRSVNTWSGQMNERIIPAYIELRGLLHDQETAKRSKTPIFGSLSIRELMAGMKDYLSGLVVEYSEHKKGLSERQLAAEKDRSLQDAVWIELQALQFLGDLVADGERYGDFRDAYVQAATEMRASLSLPLP